MSKKYASKALLFLFFICTLVQGYCCLDSCLKCEWLEGKTGQIIHLLYEADVVDEDSLLEWYNDLKENESTVLNEVPLVKFFNWLQQASEESEDSE